VHDLKPYVTDDEHYDCLINFMYLETKEHVDEFLAWVKSLDNPNIQGLFIKFAFSGDECLTWLFFIAWWDHKLNNH
jgi:hypothetical protein